MIEGFFGLILGLIFIGYSAVAVGAEELQTEITEEDLPGLLTHVDLMFVVVNKIAIAIKANILPAIKAT